MLHLALSICYFPGRVEDLIYLLLPQITTMGIFGGIIKGFNGGKADQSVNLHETRENVIAHLESIFSRFPFSDSVNISDGDLTEFNIGYLLFSSTSVSVSLSQLHTKPL